MRRYRIEIVGKLISRKKRRHTENAETTIVAECINGSIQVTVLDFSTA